MTSASKMADRVLEALDGMGVSYEVLECDPDFADTAAFCEEYGYPIDNCGNTIFVASKKEPIRYATCIVKGSMRLDVNKTVRKLMGVSRASFASAEQTMVLTGMTIGGARRSRSRLRRRESDDAGLRDSGIWQPVVQD